MISIASDFAGFHLKENIKAYLSENNYQYIDYGTFSEDDKSDYPIFGYRACKAIIDKECDRGILICGSGVGMSIVANKIDGIRCVCCTEPYSSGMSRAHNNSNVLALGARITASGMARLIVQSWLETEYESGIHQRRLDRIQELELTGSVNADL